MRRREFMTLLGAAAATWPLAARAQQPERMRRIGVLNNRSEDTEDGRIRIGALGQGLREVGWTEGTNIKIDYRWIAGGNTEQAAALAKELIALRPEVLFAQGTLSLQALSRQTQSLPIVFANVSDPVGDGFVASLAHPGGNITGFSQYEYTIGGKWLELLKELVPSIRRVAAVFNASNPASPNHLRTLGPAAASLQVQVFSMPVHNAAELESSMGAFATEPNSGLIQLPGAANVFGREQVVRLAARHRLPAIYAVREEAIAGGLLSYGIDPVDPVRRAASYVDRILKGEKPADLPVQQPIKYELVINLKTARALGIDVPPGFSARADEVIE
jgi:putative ABC transport system substrate-binding protein